MNKRTSILIVDDHVLVRMGYKAILKYEPDLYVVGEANDGESAVKEAERLKPDIVLMDLRLPGISGAEATRRIIAHQPKTRILMVTSFSGSQDLADAAAYGACGGIAKECSSEDLLDAIRHVAAGESVFPPGILPEIKKASNTYGLTDKQLSILLSLTRGLNNIEIATEHSISRNSVKQHLKAIFLKLNVANRTEATAIALREHLLKI